MIGGWAIPYLRGTLVSRGVKRFFFAERGKKIYTPLLQIVEGGRGKRGEMKKRQEKRQTEEARKEEKQEKETGDESRSKGKREKQ